LKYPYIYDYLKEKKFKDKWVNVIKPQYDT
jgi:hypothetical protein